MDKEQADGMIATLAELGDDAQSVLDDIAANGIDAESISSHLQFLAAGIGVLANAFSIWVVESEAIKILASEEV